MVGVILQLRRPLLSIPKNEPRGRSGARLSTTRRGIQPKNKPLGKSTRTSVCVFVCVSMCVCCIINIPPECDVQGPNLRLCSNAVCLSHLSPDWLFSLCSVSCLMFRKKETLLDCEGETQPLNPHSPRARVTLAYTCTVLTPLQQLTYILTYTVVQLY